jgi:hydrogenase/urease accessory protein HupE
VVFALPLAWLAGMTAAAVVNVPPGPVWLTCTLTIALGVLVAADRQWPVAAVTGLAAVAGATHGFGNGRELATVNGAILTMAGIVCALFVVSALIAGQVASVRAYWARVVVRVAGSWIAAIGLLMFGWAMR